jgi:hypothetical protein
VIPLIIQCSCPARPCSLDDFVSSEASSMMCSAYGMPCLTPTLARSTLRQGHGFLGTVLLSSLIIERYNIGGPPPTFFLASLGLKTIIMSCCILGCRRMTLCASSGFIELGLGLQGHQCVCSSQQILTRSSLALPGPAPPCCTGACIGFSMTVTLFRRCQ